ncbi:hypothetical protein ACLUS7_00410 [Enterobacterales bacterium BD_CKDN230030183-1A_HGKHYDSX7]
MNRLLLSCACVALMSAQLGAHADGLNASAQPSNDQRAQLEAQRDRLTGADHLGRADTVADDWVDTPVDTQDTPKQESQP